MDIRNQNRCWPWLLAALLLFSGVGATSAQAARLAAGYNHTCAIDGGGQARCWGGYEGFDQTSYGQLGDGTHGFRQAFSAPQRVANVALISIFTGKIHSCGLTSGGAAWCWGRNNVGQLGDGTATDRATPVAVSGLASGVKALALGYEHSCALLNTGKVRCWGNAGNGRLGTGSTSNLIVPMDVEGLGGSAVAIGAGGAHTCAVLSDGRLRCWGSNEFGQVGDGGGHGNRTAPVDVALGGVTVSDVALGGSYTCALTRASGIKCWGHGAAGELGNGSNSLYSNVPVDVTGLTSDVVRITAGNYHSCAVKRTGQMLCWGENGDGQLGIGQNIGSAYTPQPVVGLEGKIREISAGYRHTCALMGGSRIQCWGDNSGGRLGYGEGRDSIGSASFAVSGSSSALKRVSIKGSNGCGITDRGAAMCWGSNDSGTVGDGAMTTNYRGELVLGLRQSGPRQVAGLTSRVRDIAVGNAHACAVRDDGSVWCWGNNQYNQLGGGTMSVHRTPIRVEGITNAKAIAAGAVHTCVLTTAGAVTCWGTNDKGQLGDGTTIGRPQRVTVSGLASGVAQISLGDYHSCARLTNHRLECWGYNRNGRLGDGTKVDRTLPTNVADTATWNWVAAGSAHTCGITTAGQAKCWGENSGQLGDGSFHEQWLPNPVSGLASGVSDIEAGGRHTCAVHNGTLKCWGYNHERQLGDGTNTSRSTAVPVLNVTAPFEGLALGDSASCVKDSVAFKCWGDSSVTGSGYWALGSQEPTAISRFDASYGAGTWLANNTPLPAQSGVAGQWSEYRLAVPPGAKNLSIGTSGGTGTVHLLVQYEGQPTAAATGNICARTTSGTAKSCDIANPAAGIYQIALYGGGNYSGVTLKASYTATLAESVPVNNLAAPEDASLSFTVAVPAGTKNLRFALSGGTGNADLYVRRGSSASATAYDCASTGSTNAETCAITNPASGTWHVQVYGYAAFSGAKLVASYNDGSSSYPLTLRKDGTGNGSVSSASGTVSCGPSNWPCTTNLSNGASIVLTPTASAGSSFIGWTGCTTVSGTNCTVVASHAYTVTATFSNAPPTATLRFDNAITGPTTKTIVRNSNMPVTFAWKTTSLPAGATCKILRRPDDSYGKSASPAAGGTVIDTGIHTWAAGTKTLYLRCSNNTISPDIKLTINAS